jgi:serine/threonine-protein kinase
VPDSSPPSPTLEPGTVLDRYELLCTIARGGMAHVWLGRFKGKHGFEKLVAVKTILPEHALDERFRNMFLDEARIASGVEHPNVAKILDLGEWRDCLYLVMEYVDGDSLSRLRRSVEKRNVKLPLPLTLRILADTCAGLHAAHDLRSEDGSLLNVVHRDISPQNVLIPTNGVSKLIDFGVAKARHRLGEETSAGFAKGKSRYMSPEQALSKPVDRRADLFAVGAMAYEMFEGNAPYDGPNDMARLHALITGEPIKVVKHSPHPSIEKIIVKALAREPDERYSTANEMRVAIEDAMVQLKVRASADEIAAFVAEHTSERIVERKRVVKVALDAAAERQRIKDMLSEGTLSGRKEHLSAPDLSPASDISLPSPPGVPNADPPVESAPPAFSASVHENPGAGNARARRRKIALVAGVAAFSVTLLAIAFSMRGGDGTAAAKSASASSLAPTASSAAPQVASNIPTPTQTTSATMVAPPTSTTATTTGTTKPVPSIRHTAPTSTTKPHGTGKPHDVVIQ